MNKAKDLLTRNQTRLLGVVLNKFQRRDAGASFGYGYGYGYGNRPDDAVVAEVAYMGNGSAGPTASGLGAVRIP